ncbi:DUF7713 domain-containing protein [Streptomyces sp. NPDC003032]
MLGDHDADLNYLTTRVRAEADVEIGRRCLEPYPQGAGWRPAGEEIAGRLIWAPEGAPFRVVVDGRTPSWHELGEALSSFESSRFRLTIDGP